ncbi:MAG: thiamine-phosphate kinase [Alistipes sp.]|nr:thiamine-phosphate kinase [Alistipes sp.]
MAQQKKRTEIAELGEFGLIDRLTAGFGPGHASTLRGVGDDAAVLALPDGERTVVSADSFFEGVDFDLTYFPLKHLGYKVVTAAVSDILAMNATPSQLFVSLGISAKLPVEALDDLYEGIRFACKESGIDLAGGDTRASMTGLVISVTAVGHAPEEKIVGRDGAQQNDLICLTGNVGAAYMGLQLLEREKRVLADIDNPEPKFAGYEYLLEKYLKPRPRTDILAALAEEKIVPTSMIDLSDGLSSDLLQLCRASQCGARIYLERIPIAKQTSALAEEMHSDPVVAALHGGEDYELLFTVPLSMQEQVARLGLVDIIGHITPRTTGCFLVTPDGSDIRLKAQGFPESEK